MLRLVEQRSYRKTTVDVQQCPLELVSLPVMYQVRLAIAVTRAHGRLQSVKGNTGMSGMGREAERHRRTVEPRPWALTSQPKLVFLTTLRTAPPELSSQPSEIKILGLQIRRA